MSESAKRFLGPEAEKQVIQAIQQAERDTSGEIRVHLDTHSDKTPLARAKEVFAHLNMHRTQARNGVLFYVAVDDKTFAIFGDEGIDQAVPEDFWESIRDTLCLHFKAGRFVQGLVEGIAQTGKALKAYFPHQRDDVNELPDDISTD